ncbi:calcineurin-like phosphoesterase C-terminal domain-containing protein [Lysobacter korlensis]|uniref:Calcineurin-like phosphoesterase C-terminal domain-containing protein n=1 Tax=Lysobacter korlensis TaxID=553636 RepID=A0ABV6RLL1_9GAMM
MRALLSTLLLFAGGVSTAAASCLTGTVFEDRDGDGVRDAREPGLPRVLVSDGVELVRTGTGGEYRLPAASERPVFVIKPPTHSFAVAGPVGPGFWQMPSDAQAQRCDFALKRRSKVGPVLDVLVFADPQAQSEVDVDYYKRDIVESVLRDTAATPANAGASGAAPAADLGLTLGDVVARGRTDLYPSLDKATARLQTPWLHVPGNHDMDSGAGGDADALHSFVQHYGPDTFAWEEPQATFVLLDDVIRLPPGQQPAYVGGLREEQFTFLERYLATVPTDRLLVVALHIPLFDAAPGRETFRRADRERLFSLLQRFPKRLVLSGHSHAQRHHLHDASSGWTGAEPLHEFNVGAASGAYWSGVKDAAGIPDATMSDGTPNGYARLRVDVDGDYRLSWHPARLANDDPATTSAMHLHAPRVLRRGAYPAWGVYANVYMGRPDSRVEYRVDDGRWRPMQRVEAPDPRLLAQNVADDAATALRGYDRSPEATPSPHLWRGALPTDLGVGEHRIEVRTVDPWLGEQRAKTSYRLEDAAP